jgi:hypothetical protein
MSRKCGVFRRIQSVWLWNLDKTKQRAAPATKNGDLRNADRQPDDCTQEPQSYSSRNSAKHILVVGGAVNSIVVGQMVTAVAAKVRAPVLSPQYHHACRGAVASRRQAQLRLHGNRHSASRLPFRHSAGPFCPFVTQPDSRWLPLATRNGSSSMIVTAATVPVLWHNYSFYTAIPVIVVNDINA